MVNGGTLVSRGSCARSATVDTVAIARWQAMTAGAFDDADGPDALRHRHQRGPHREHRDPRVDVGGKTGTGRSGTSVAGPGRRTSFNSTFVGYIGRQAGHPDLVVAVRIEEGTPIVFKQGRDPAAGHVRTSCSGGSPTTPWSTTDPSRWRDRARRSLERPMSPAHATLRARDGPRRIDPPRRPGGAAGARAAIHRCARRRVRRARSAPWNPGDPWRRGRLATDRARMRSWPCPGSAPTGCGSSHGGGGGRRGAARRPAPGRLSW